MKPPRENLVLEEELGYQQCKQQARAAFSATLLVFNELTGMCSHFYRKFTDNQRIVTHFLWKFIR
jgi:hypothetical protein